MRLIIFILLCASCACCSSQKRLQTIEEMKYETSSLVENKAIVFKTDSLIRFSSLSFDTLEIMFPAQTPDVDHRPPIYVKAVKGKLSENLYHKKFIAKRVESKDTLSSKATVSHTASKYNTSTKPFILIMSILLVWIAAILLVLFFFKR